MVKELEKLNDFVDGFLSVTLDEEEGTYQNGKVTFLNKFRDYLTKVSSDTAGTELVKALNRGLLKATNTLPFDASINQRKGFESALKEVQEKIKALFNLDDLSTGTIKQYLQDIPKIDIPQKAVMPEASVVFGQGMETEDSEAKIREEAAHIHKTLDKQIEILERHAQNNGKVIVLSDEGYTDLGDIDTQALAGLIEGSKKSKQSLNDMVEKSIMLMKMLKDRKNRGGKGGKKGPSTGNDFLDNLLNGKDDDSDDDE